MLIFLAKQFCHQFLYCLLELKDDDSVISYKYTIWNQYVNQFLFISIHSKTIQL